MFIPTVLAALDLVLIGFLFRSEFAFGMSALDAFWDAPSESLLLTLTVKQLIEVAECYSIEITLLRNCQEGPFGVYL